MNKTEQKLKHAWDNNYSCRTPVTYVKREGNTMLLVYIGAQGEHNTIATKVCNTELLWFTLCGWNSLTTRKRLKNICGINIYQKNHEPYWNDMVIDVNRWYDIRNINTSYDIKDITSLSLGH